MIITRILLAINSFQSVVSSITISGLPLTPILGEFMKNTYYSNSKPSFTKPLRVLLILVIAQAFYATKATAETPIIDSLMDIVNQNNISEARKVEVKLAIAENYLKVNPAVTLEYTDQLVIGLEENKDRTVAGKILYVAGRACLLTSQLEAGEEYLMRAVKFFEQDGSTKEIGDCYKDLGTIKLYQNDHDQAIESYRKAKSHYENAGYLPGAGHCSLNTGNVWKRRGKLVKAMEYYLEALSIYDKIGVPVYQGFACNNLGTIYNSIKKYDQAEKYYLKAAKYYEGAENLSQHINLNINLGLISEELGNIERGLQQYEKAITIAKNTSFKKQIPLAYNNKAALLLDLERYDEAKEAMQNAFYYSELDGNEEQKSRAYYHLANYQFKKGDYKKALASAKETYQWSSNNEEVSLSQLTAAKMADIYEALGQPVEALEYLKTSQQLLDSIRSRDVIQSIATQSFEFQLEQQKQEQEIKELKTKLEYEAKIDRQRNILYLSLAGLLVSVFLLYFIYRNYRSKVKAERLLDWSNKKLEQKNEELNQYIESNLQLENFAYIASHDLRAPVRSIVSFSQLLERSLGDRINESEKEYIDYIISSSVNMQTLINDLLQFSQVGTQKLKPQYIDPRDLLDDLLKQLYEGNSQAMEKVSIADMPDLIHADPGLLKQLFQNLIENAMKFSKDKENQKVIVGAKEKNNEYEFFIKDNGIGIAPEFQDKIFLIFERLHHQSDFQGTGIGLSLCKKIVEQHQGKIRVESKVGEGSTFYFTLPKAEILEPVLT